MIDMIERLADRVLSVLVPSVPAYAQQCQEEDLAGCCEIPCQAGCCRQRAVITCPGQPPFVGCSDCRPACFF